MKKIVYAILILFLLALAACSKTDIKQQSAQKPSETINPVDQTVKDEIKQAPPAQTQPENTQAQETVTDGKDCTVADNALAEIKKIMENPEKIESSALIPNTYLDVHQGECVIFPYAVRNTMLDSKVFLVKTDFESAKENTGITNELTADNAVMNGWLSETDNSAKTIAPREYSIFQIKVRAKDMRTKEDKTSPGTYKYNVQAYYKTGESSEVKYLANRGIFIRVK